MRSVLLLDSQAAKSPSDEHSDYDIVLHVVVPEKYAKGEVDPRVKAGVAAAAATEPDRLSVRAIQNYAGRLRDQPFLLQTGTFDPWTTPEATKQLLRAPGHTNERAEGVPQRPPPPHMIYQ